MYLQYINLIFNPDQLKLMERAKNQVLILPLTIQFIITAITKAIVKE